MRLQKAHIGLLQVGIIVLTIATALIHFSLVFPGGLFILNGLGYLALLAALYLPIAQLTSYRGLIRWVLMGYTALTIILWVFMGARIPIAYVDKVIEIVLIVLLWLESQEQLER